MAVHGLSYSKENWFVTKDDPGKRDTLEESKSSGATIFYHRAIPNAVMTEIQDDQNSQTVRAVQSAGSTGMEQVLNQRTARRNRECFRFGIKRWDNFTDADGNPLLLTFEREMRGQKVYDVVSEDSLNQCHLSLIGEVGSEIFQRNSMDDAKVKKFEAALSGLDDTQNGIVENAADKTSTNADVSATDVQETATSSKKSASGKKSGKTPPIVASDAYNPSLSNLSG